jgi:CHAT domain-containing protein/tetratricopeptide (TPR) repeat protein
MGTPEPSARRRGWLRAGLWMLLMLSSCATRADAALVQLLQQAEEAFTQKGPAAALPLFEQALASARAVPDSPSEATALRKIGACHRGMGNYPQAIDAVQQALAIARTSNARLEEGKGLSQLGLVYWEIGDYTRAEQQFQQAIALAHEQHDRHLEAAALNNLALVNDERGRYTESIAGYERALALYAQDPMPHGESDTLSNIGGVHLLLGRFEQALAHFERALAIDRARGDASAIGTDQGNSGLALQGLGRYQEADHQLQLAIDATRASGQKTDEAFWLKGRAGVLINLGRYDLALELYRHALTLYEQSGAQGEYLEARADFGELLLRLGDLAGAEEQFTSALAIARAIGHHRGETQALIRLGDLQGIRNQDAEAIASFRAALTRAEAVGDQARSVEALVQLAGALSRTGKPDDALRMASRALDIAAKSRQPWLEARAQLELAALAESASDAATARRGFERALRSSESLGDPELLWRSRFGLARVLATAGDIDAAIAELERTVAVIEGVRSQIQQRRYRSGYLDDKYEVYVELVRLLLEAGRIERAFSVSENLRAQAYRDMQARPAIAQSRAAMSPRESALLERIETLQASLRAEHTRTAEERRDSAIASFSSELAGAERAYAELLDDIHGATTTRAQESDEAAVRRALQPGDAIVSYVVGNRGITAFVLRNNSLSAMQLVARRRELRARVELLRELVLDASSEAWRGPARALAELLVDPLIDAGWLAGVDQLYVVPDGELNYLPFAVLLVGGRSEAHPLIADAVLRLLPSAAMLGIAPDSSPVPASRLLAVAPQAARLRHADAEARAVAAMHKGGTELWTGAAATEHRFKQEAGGFDLLHVATHGEFNSLNPALSALEFEAGEGDDGKLRVQEILELQLRAQLVTLSACNTALGSGYFSDVPIGNEFIGLTRAFLQAGSRGVLSSLWPVDDRFTSRFMVDFYAGTAGAGYATALAGAQRRMAGAGGPYSHPYFWAPYVLIGGPEQGDHDAGKTAARYVSVPSTGRPARHGAVNAARE